MSENIKSNNNPISNLKSSLGVITETAEKMSSIAEKGPSNLLMTLGSTIIIFSLAIKIELLGVKFTSMTPIEFVFILITGWLFLGGASLMKYLQYKDKYNMKKLVWESSQKQIEMANDQHKSTSDFFLNAKRCDL